jgi:tetratricopeptide (TPR) repeat protein
MDIIVAGNGDLAQVSRQQAVEDPEQTSARIIHLSSWMMVLGTVRLVCALGDAVNAFLEMNRGAIPSLRVLGRFLQVNPPAILLGMSWPLILGLILRKTAGRAYLLAGAVTFFILSLGGIVNLVEGLALRPDWSILIGSFSLSRWALLHFGTTAMIRALMGAIQLTLELATAFTAWNLALSLRSAPPADVSRPGASRRLLRGRIALYLSIAFLALNLRLPLWTAYIALLNKSSIVRELVMRSEPSQTIPHRGTISPPPRRELDIDMGLAGAARLASSNQIREAKKAYLHVIARAEANGSDSNENEGGKIELARALNNLAWMLATCEDARLRQPTEALGYAKRAVKLVENEGTYWNTLGAAYFRVQNWAEAKSAFHRSMDLRAGGAGDAFDWFFLAMIHVKFGEKEQGRQWYERAVAWFHETREDDPELYRFQVEAAEVLGLPRPPAPAIRNGRHPQVVSPDPGLVRRRLRRAPVLLRGDSNDG